MTLETKLKEIRERLESATPGPWYSDKNGEVEGAVFIITGEAQGYDYPPTEIIMKSPMSIDQDAKFVAHAPDDIAMLLELVEFYKKIAFDKSKVYWMNDVNKELDEIMEKYK